jgi:hypothetical protein
LHFTVATLPNESLPIEDASFDGEVYVNSGFEQILSPLTFGNKIPCTPVDLVAHAPLIEYGQLPGWWTDMNARYDLTESVQGYKVLFNVPNEYHDISDFYNNFVARGELTLLYDDVTRVCPRVELASNNGRAWTPPNMYRLSHDDFSEQQILVSLAMNDDSPSECFEESEEDEHSRGVFQMCLQFWRVEYRPARRVVSVITPEHFAHISFLSVSMIEDRICIIDDVT